MSLSSRLLLLTAVLGCWLVVGRSFAEEPAVESTTDLVGRSREEYIFTPVNQLLTPFGRLLELPGLRPQALALSPDGKLLLVSGKTSELLVVDPEKGEVKQRVKLPADDKTEAPEAPSPNILMPDLKGQVSFTGLIFSPDGKRVYLSNVNGSIKVFAITAEGELAPSHTLPLPPANAPRRKPEIPSGLAVSKDGAKLYVCGNLSNRLIELDTASGKTVRTYGVGAAPYDVVLVGDKAYVSNWAGRRPDKGDLVGPAGRGTEVRVDAVRHIANEGSVCIVQLGPQPKGPEPKPVELLTGLHASALAVSPDQKYVVCANAGSDNLSIIDVAAEKVIETVWTKAKPSDLFGASPNALAFDADGKRLFVANGTQNAIAVIKFDPQDKGDSVLQGLIPVGWFPGAVVFDKARGQLYAANIKGLPVAPKKQGGTGKEGFNSHHYSGSLSLVPLPSAAELAKLSERAAKNMRRGSIAQAALPPRKDQPPRPIPERIGEPSTIKHVVYVIKENRTYDQVFGAHKKGRGNADLCIFGADITVNQHKLVDEFVLLDNTYCSGILSADGHQWSTTAFSTDYMEKSFAGFPRSYPDGMGPDESDALAYSPAGFIWDNALLHGKTIRNYGEFMGPKVRYSDPAKQGRPNFLACYRTWKGDSKEVIFESEPSIETIRPFSPTKYVGWDMSVPDQFRADFILAELKDYEAKGEFPNLVIICLPNDHGSGASRGCPTPAACTADNDLAFGRIVEALSHSKFWKEMAIFGIEDDPQNGWDHVSGYRTTAYCISPFAKRGAVVSTQYNTTSLLRTMEQILGMKPMNQFDASATPMFDCFTDQPDFTPFKSVPNKVPLDQMNPDPAAILDPILRQDALVSATLNFLEVDKAPEDVLNRIIWRSIKGTKVPYPDWAVSAREDEEEEEERERQQLKKAARKSPFVRIGSGVSGHIHPAACVAKSGRVLVIYGQSDYKELRLSWSDDGGQTWTDPTAFAPSAKLSIYPGALKTLADGRILHVWNTWYPDDKSKGGKSRFPQYSTSSDEGRTWSEPRSLPKNPEAQSVLRHPPIELTENKWLCALMDKTVVFDPKTDTAAPFGDGRNHGLTPLVRTTKGTFISAIQGRSTDEGRTWQKVEPFPKIADNGWRFDLLALDNGWLVTAEVEGPGVGGECWRFIVSRDDGQSWDFDDTVELYNPGRPIGGRACPKTVQLDKETLGTVFYDTDASQPGGAGVFFLKTPIASLAR